MYSALFALCAYLIGSISFAVVISKLFGLADPRSYGSKNPGATNVLRSGNKAAAVFTLLGDCAKGWLAVWLAQYYGDRFGVGEAGIALVALAVFLGHLWPVFFRFVGGKGVATALGVLIGIDIWMGLATLATWLIVAYLSRYSSLAALICSLLVPIFYIVQFGGDIMLVALMVMSALLIYRHRQNLGNLIAGKEGKIGAKKNQGEQKTADKKKEIEKKSEKKP